MSKDVWDMTDEELEQAVSEERETIVNEADTENDEPESESNESEADIEENETEEQPEDLPEEEETEVQSSEPEGETEDSNTEGEEPAPEEGQTEETPVAETQKFKPLIVDGEEIPINDINELYTMASAGGRVTQKFQELAQHRRTISAMQEAGLTENDINLLIEAQKGDKNAIASLVKKSGIDPMDVDVEDEALANYQPAQYGKTEAEQAILDIQQAISGDAEYERTVHVIDDMWDNESRNQVVEDPNIIIGLHNDIKSGLYDRVAPEAKKLAIADGMRRPQLDYYIQAGQLVTQSDSLAQQQNQDVINAEKQRTAKRKSAVSNKGKRVAKKAELDFNKMSDDEAWALREQIMSRS